MGWSVDTVAPAVDFIFRSLGIAYQMSRPDALSPRVFINHDGELPVEAKQAITALFPETVRVDFLNTHIPGVTFAKKGQRIEAEATPEKKGQKTGNGVVVKKKGRRIGGS